MVLPISRPQRPFWIKRAVRHCRRCGVAGTMGIHLNSNRTNYSSSPSSHLEKVCLNSLMLLQFQLSLVLVRGFSVGLISDFQQVGAMLCVSNRFLYSHFIATLGSILESQLSCESCKFQLAKWGHKVALFLSYAGHPPTLPTANV